eukprot:COSAG01_NODE_722_length_14067_cov_145.626289_10_plen_144_part_01
MPPPPRSYRASPRDVVCSSPQGPRLSPCGRRSQYKRERFMRPTVFKEHGSPVQARPISCATSSPTKAGCLALTHPRAGRCCCFHPMHPHLYVSADNCITEYDLVTGLSARPVPPSLCPIVASAAASPLRRARARFEAGTLQRHG